MSAKEIVLSNLVTTGELWEVSEWDSDDMVECLTVAICHKSISQSKVSKNYFVDLHKGIEETLNAEDDFQECKMRPIENIEKYADFPKVDWC